MSRLGFALCGPLLCLPTASLAEDLHQERAAVREQLSAARAALTAAREQKVRVLEALDFTEQLARASSFRARALDSELTYLRGRLEFVRQERDSARSELLGQLDRIQPRLFMLYRLTREIGRASCRERV